MATKIMRTKNIFLKKLALLYSLLILFVFNGELYSQIIYTDIPDITPNATYVLDLNNDAIDDFVIQMSDIDKVVCYPQDNNAYAGEFINGTYLSWAMSPLDSICPSLVTWYGANNPGTLALGTSTGHWVGQTDKYLALKLIVGTNTYYGWVRLDLLAGSTSFTIKDYAYQGTPNSCIQLGQSTLDINENTTKTIFSIFPNPFIASTAIYTVSNLKNTTLTVYNSYGQAVKQVNNSLEQTVFLSRDNLPSGLYFIRLAEENKIIAVEKLIITD